MEIFIIITVSALNIACFLVGVRVGQKVSKGEEIKLPRLNPAEIIREERERRHEEAEQSRLAAILENIENYDGTPCGQKDIPGGE